MDLLQCPGVAPMRSILSSGTRFVPIWFPYNTGLTDMCLPSWATYEIHIVIRNLVKPCIGLVHMEMLPG